MTPSNTEESLVERVARAISLASSLAVHGGTPAQWAAVVDKDWPDYEGEARAAISVIMEPTEALSEVASRELGAKNGGGGWLPVLESHEVRIAVRAYVQAALSEGEG